MCLAVPGKIVEMKDNQMADVEVNGVKMEIGLHLIGEVQVGDYVLVHAGYAIAPVDEESAKETMEFLKEIEELDEIARLAHQDEIH
ncbi:MAG: HypC/HybG/HupF family hydrogenase formation chaperone [Actinomycetota bacterium]|nr:HypC/HybG/HupF family hydrogenase formation chaperone [Actinomycetota bacterium]